MKKRILLFVGILMSLCSQNTFAQEAESVQDKIEILEEAKQYFIEKEKERLRELVKEVNTSITKKDVSEEEGQKRKEEYATKTAANIQNTISIYDNQIAYLKRNNIMPEIYNKCLYRFKKGDSNFHYMALKPKRKKINDIFEIFPTKHNHKKDKRTYNGILISAGLNNALVDGSLDDSPYKIGGSRYFEMGWLWETRLLKNSNFVRVNYGLSLQFNGLKPEDNGYFVQNGDQTTIEDFRVPLDKAKLRMDNLVLPIHFEFGSSNKIEKEDYFRYNTVKKFTVGIGGYAGVNLSTRQKLKYEENGDKIVDKIKRNYNTSNFIYGLSGYVGFGNTSLFVKYDLNPLFKNATVDHNNISLGLRLGI